MTEPRKARVATVSLAGCFGCHMAILDIDERLIALMERVEFDRSPLTDIKTFTQRCDIGIIEGGCCNEENVHTLIDFRKNCDVLIALGQCAIMGGLPAMRNAIMHAQEPLRECLEEAYISGPYLRNTTRQIPNDPVLPLVLDRVYPCSEIVDIDYQIPGCAPSGDIIFTTLVALLDGKFKGFDAREPSLRLTRDAPDMTETRLIEISPVTRVEGHGKVTIHLDENNKVDEARLHIVEFRGFERFIRGRLLWEVPVIVQRLCGICPVSHHLAAAKAMDQIVGVDTLPPTAEKMRRLMHYGQVMQSHVLHFFHLSAPDLLFGFGAPAAKRNIFEVIRENPELGLRAVLMRKFGQEIIEATAGKKIHGTGAIPGGINRNLDIATRDRLLAQVDQMLDWSQDALAIARNYVQDHKAMVDSFGSFPSSHMSLVREGDGALDLYHGRMRALDATRRADLRHARLQRLSQGADRGCPQLVLHEVPLHQRAWAG